jgi:hypothetical protein
VVRLDKARTAKLQRLYEITNKLLNEMVKDKDIDLNKYLKPQPCKTLNEVYEQALSSLCNRQGMRNNIKFERSNEVTNQKRSTELEENIQERSTQIKEILFDFDPKIVKNKLVEKEGYDKDKGLKSLIDTFNKKFNLKIESQKDRQWWEFGKGVISAAIFLSEFQDYHDFDVFIKGFQRNKYSSVALPMLLHKEISGFGFALSCDFLKEAGYDGYPKPDLHLMDVFEKSGLCKWNDYEVFKTIIEVAEAVGKTPYEVDKRIWLVCTGNFYFDNVKDKKGKKDELMQLAEKMRTELKSF